MNEYERLRRQAIVLRDMYPPGTRVECLYMNDPFAPVPSGTTQQYVTRNINKLRFKYNKNQNYDYTYNASKESWYIADNIITKCCTAVGELLTNFYKKIDDTLTSNYIFGDILSYRPFTADVFARWWLEPGDKIAIKTGYNDTETVESFVLSRTLKGINGMRCIIKATGTEFLGKDEITSG